jgi:hypothetical protein
MIKELSCPKGLNEELFREVEQIIIEGFKKDKSPDTIKTALIKHTDLPFNRLNSVFNLIAKHHNLIVNPIEIKSKIKEYIEQDNGILLTYTENWSDIEKIINILKEVDQQYTPQRVLAVLRWFFKQNDTPFPKKPRVIKGRIGHVNRVIIEVFSTNEPKEVTEHMLREALQGVVKNVDKYVTANFKLAYALANNLTVDETLEQLNN